MNRTLKQELLQMIQEDTHVREELAADGSLFEGYHPRMEQVHQKNAARLREIIQAYGWPGIDLVGTDGEEAAWLIAQHSIGEPDFMRDVFLLLKTAAAEGQAPLYQIAFMEDRIRMFEGRLQLYGTSFDWDDQALMSPYPEIEDPEHLDERRASVGLPPMQQEIARKRMEIEKPPANLKERRKQMQEWARSVGWIE